MDIIEKYEHQSSGYHPFLIGPKWQVAQLNYSPDEALENKNRLDVHRFTDEAFLLIQGHAVLVAAKINQNHITYDLQLMMPGIVYNIPKEVWHNIVLKPGAKVLIIENANTHLPLPDGDYEFYYFSETEKTQFKDEVLKRLNQIVME